MPETASEVTFVPVNIKEKFGMRVRTLRLKNGLSLESLANKAELDRTYIPSIEKGKRNVSIIVIEKLANALNVEISDLFEKDQ
ncbi:MAG: helix-turn-helix domain-containing protein [Cyclobacteriaceae bacterium]